MISDVIGRLKNRKTTAEERIGMFLERIEMDNPYLNAVLYVNPDALGQAKEIDKKIKAGNAGALAGLGIVVKSNISVKGLPVSCASKVLENYSGTFDADVISAIKKEDGVILGMANCDEFAAGSTGENSAFGPTQNPAAPGRISGGTSSGSAASVSAGFCDIAIGSDTGGSIRNPSSHCGVIGFKPTYGIVSRYGLVDSSMSLDTIGVISKDVYGVSLMMSIISMMSDNDARMVSHEIDFLSGLDGGIKGKIIGVSKIFKEMCEDKRIYDALESNLALMKDKLGIKVREIEIPYVD
ncbi:MAG: Asp-tRNA(Asn)/Glu-tRNA(Gln) amidotransferase GatCAB subunit A, partial [Nanoarchaeota archaeon]